MPNRHSTNGNGPASSQPDDPHQHHGHGGQASDADSALAPHFARIAADLRDKIASGYYGPGALLPSMNELRDQYGVSTTTARRALTQLDMEGLTAAHRGRGHIVIRPRPRATLPVRRLNPSDGPPQPDAAQTLINSGLSSVRPEVAALFNDAEPPARLYQHTTRIDDQHGNPVEVRTCYAPPDADPAHLDRTLSPGDDFTHAVTEATGRAATHARAEITARPATPDEIEALRLSNMAAVVMVADTITYDHSQRALTLIRSVLPADTTRLTDYYQTPATPPC